MATPASVFRPAPVEPVPSRRPLDVPGSLGVPVPLVPPSPREVPVVDRDVRAVEWEAVLSPIGRLCLPGNQQIKFAAALANRTVTVWADDRSIHVLLDGHLIRTRPSRFSTHDLRDLLDRGGRGAGPEPGVAALPAGPVPVTSVIECDRTVGRDGDVGLGGARVMLDPPLAGQQVILRFDGQLLHVIADGLLVKTLPAPIEPSKRAKLTGARSACTPLPPPPAQPLRAIRRVPADGVAMVPRQRLRIGRAFTPARPWPSRSRTPCSTSCSTVSSCPLTPARRPRWSPGSKPTPAPENSDQAGRPACAGTVQYVPGLSRMSWSQTVQPVLNPHISGANWWPELPDPRTCPRRAGDLYRVDLAMHNLQVSPRYARVAGRFWVRS
jgi:hypothetical protein